MPLITRRMLLAAITMSLALPAFAQDKLAKLEGVVKSASPLGDSFIGKADAKVVLIEYASATCPHCAEFHEKLLPQIKAEYVDTGKIKFIFREFPFDQLGQAVFMLARCLPREKHFPALEEIFKKQKIWTQGDAPAEVFKIMNSFGMTKPEFEACLRRDDMAKSMFEYTKQSAESFGIKGTPALFVNEKLIDGHKEMSAVKAALDAAIAEASK